MTHSKQWLSRLLAPAAMLVLCTNVRADHSVTITVGAKDLPATPVTAVLPTELAEKSVVLTDKESGKPVVSQADTADGKPALTWILPAMKAGTSKTYNLAAGTPPEAPANEGVKLEQSGDELKINVDGELFTSYVSNGPYKPYWWPMIGPTGKPITRAFPMERGVKGELFDHHHHRSFWFTHGNVNGTDFWMEAPAAGKTIHREYKNITSGPVFGEFVAVVDWKDRKGMKVCEDERRFRVYDVPDGRLFDFFVDVKATDGPVTFGDTKEGMFGFRVAGTMNVKAPKNVPKGTLVNSEGMKDQAVWGKQANWCDYYGTVDGEMVGIAMFDNPKNFRHPTHWHARDYGLYCANPFGISDFTGDKSQNGAHTIPAGEDLSFRYRIYMHKGDTQAANVPAYYEAYAEPPKVEVE
jgi:hypothetical protein